jgi:hypothetical protein
MTEAMKKKCTIYLLKYSIFLYLFNLTILASRNNIRLDVVNVLQYVELSYCKTIRKEYFGFTSSLSTSLTLNKYDRVPPFFFCLSETLRLNPLSNDSMLRVYSILLQYQMKLHRSHPYMSGGISEDIGETGGIVEKGVVASFAGIIDKSG